ncbi:MAG: DNA replication/repair protein RecF [Candidatus Neomarinimicrobiota bacterium]
MAISKLSLFSFRNHEKKEITFSKGITVIWGENGSGKTSLLEAIYILSLGKSFKTHKQSSIIKKGHTSYILKGDFSYGGITNSVAIQTNLNNTKTIKVNGKTIKNRKEIIGKNNVVVLSPEDQVITKGGPKERRLFFDRLFSIVDSDYLNTLQEFNRALKQRNALILNCKQTKGESFSPWEEKLSISAVKLWEIRKKCFSGYLKSLNSVVSEYQKSLILNVLYIEKTYKKEDFEKKLKQTRDRDCLLGTTSHGPHRDNIKILWSGKDIREYGSQGEHKISLILLKLAEIHLIKQKTGKNPTILLDDVFAKLDLNRSKKLVSYLNSIKTEEKDPIQTIITTTDVLNVEQSGLILDNKDVKTHKLELSWNI